MVVDDEVATNTIEKSGLKLATPAGVKLSILPIEKAATNILAGKYDSQRVLIVAKARSNLIFSRKRSSYQRSKCGEYVTNE